MIDQFLPDSLPLVGFAVIADDKHGLRHNNGEISLQRIPFLHCLCFAHDNHFASSHHREPSCGTYNRRNIKARQITTVEDLLVKLPRHLIQGILSNIRINPVGIIGFFAAKEINGRVRPSLQRAHNIIELLIHRSLVVGR